jgi:hypothetical protein
MTIVIWFFVSALYLLVAVIALQAGFPAKDYPKMEKICNYSLSAVMAASLLPAFLLRTMKSIEWFIALSDLTIVLVVGLGIFRVFRKIVCFLLMLANNSCLFS